MSKQKIFVRSTVVILVIGCLFFGWKIYQNSTRVILSVENLKNVRIKEENNQLFITGRADLDSFEKISNYGAVQKGDSLYIYIMKTKSLLKSDKIYENIDKIKISDSKDAPNKIYLVSGNRIEVKYKDNPKMNYMDVIKYSEKRELFK